MPIVANLDGTPLTAAENLCNKLFLHYFALRNNETLHAAICKLDDDQQHALEEGATKIIAEAFEAERERLAKIADDYGEWTHWGQYSNANAAEAAAEEIATALRKGRWLTTDEVIQADVARTARIKAQKAGI